MTRESPVGRGIESTSYHGTNVVSCKFVTRITQTPLVGAYLPPSTLEHLPDLEEALKRFKDPITLGDLNMDLDKARILWSQQMADLLSEYSLTDLVHHFRQCCMLRNLNTWSRVWQGTVLRSRCDYIICIDQCLFNLIGIRDMRNLLSDHLTLRAQLL